MNRILTMGIAIILVHGCSRGVTPRARVRVASTFDGPVIKEMKRDGTTYAEKRIAEEFSRRGIKFGVESSFQASFFVSQSDAFRARRIISDLIKNEGLHVRIENEQITTH